MRIMQKFRWHRGSLDDSMATVVEVSTLAGLIEVLSAGLVQPGKVEVKPYGYDARVNWDTHIVTVDGNAVGFTDGALYGS